ncbi:uncharacterized protein LOC114517556 [Dendronephthya gigantea]|uniref:uncharacterized protein LOC114517556 n=1 Tax=Dendronephthya gigantea TaxID=151771 RepID=UPI00106AFCF7|nr:uncharacterized protein LOC114517556 [Dendronephthya gigantea]
MISEEEGVWTLNSEEEEAYKMILEEEADIMISEEKEKEACKMIPEKRRPCRIISEKKEELMEVDEYPPELIRKPWIQNVLLSEKQVPIKAKARIAQLDPEIYKDGTLSGEVTDYVHSVNVVFSKEAVEECLQDQAHGNIFSNITALTGGGIVLTDYKVVPRFSDWEFVLLVNHFKVLPGFIGSLAYEESIPKNITKSKHLNEVKEKLQFLWEEQYGGSSSRISHTPSDMAKDCSQPPAMAEDLSLVDKQCIIDASIENVQCEMNSQNECGGNLSLIVDIADQVSTEQKAKDDMIELCKQYEPLENTDNLNVQDVLDQIHLAHTQYAPIGLHWETCQRNDIPSLKLNHAQPTRPSLSQGSESGSLDLKLVQTTKAYLVKLCQKYKPLDNADVLEIPDLLEILHQAHIRYAPIPYSQTTLNVRHGDVADSQRASLSNKISPHGLIDDILRFNPPTLNAASQSCSEDSSQLSRGKRLGVASLKPVTSSTTSSVTRLKDITVMRHTLSDKKSCQGLPCPSKNLIDRILNTTVSTKSANVVRPTIAQSSQTGKKPETTETREKERQKRTRNLCDFLDTYWIYRKKNKNRANKQL